MLPKTDYTKEEERLNLFLTGLKESLTGREKCFKEEERPAIQEEYSLTEVLLCGVELGYKLGQETKQGKTG